MNASPRFRRILRYAGITVLLAFAWCLIVTRIPPGKPAATSQWGANHIVAERWLLGPGADTVLVGSSMSARLPGSALGPRIANLGMPGIHALDALAVARAHRAPLRQVVIESNVLYWPPNPEFIGDVLSPVRQGLLRTVPAFRTEHQPLNLLIRLLRSEGGDAAPTRADPRLLDAEVARQAAMLATPPPAADWDAALARLDAMVQALRADGTEVRFVELPMDPRLAASPRQSAARAELLRRYPPEQWRWLRLDGAGPWATTDGVHLLAADASRAASAIAAWLDDHQAQATPKRSAN